ncbi:hypothetical protein [Stenotrophomonas sp. YIM B06876]|uniref:hypothetical protein n=1 Tax=Stenotrophomonas sp. YIM B06876 TaxID=3060211 RepID=UPI0027383A46|nr:hypothetical protein [Stenotrophomonas sp. YIM B06876]
MAVALECINLIIPVQRIAAVWPGGFNRFWREHGHLARLWHDGHLLRDGAMNPREVMAQLDWWQQQGLKVADDAAGGEQAPDVCLVDTVSGRVPVACAWLEVDWTHRLARWNGHRRRPRGATGVAARVP